MKKQIIFFLFLILSAGLILAQSNEFAEAKKLIDAKTPCSKLSEPQFEMIGDYLMEQMHPGKAHETMDEMMGGEGSESLKQMHMAIAKRVYCNDVNSAINTGFGGMMGLGYGRMMRGEYQSNYNYGMMHPYGNYYSAFGAIIWLVAIILVGMLVYWVIRSYTNDPLRTLKQRYANGEITKKEFEEIKKSI